MEALTHAVRGTLVISCKSGKDRTAMAATLVEGDVLRHNYGISQQQARPLASRAVDLSRRARALQTAEIVDCLRRDGVRRENCRKNIGKPLYSFSPFQTSFLPPSYRPPTGTYSQRVYS